MPDNRAESDELNRQLPQMLQGGEEFVEAACDEVEELVHEFGLLGFWDVDDSLAATTGEPACLSVGALAT